MDIILSINYSFGEEQYDYPMNPCEIFPFILKTESLAYGSRILVPLMIGITTCTLSCIIEETQFKLGRRKLHTRPQAVCSRMAFQLRLKVILH